MSFTFLLFVIVLELSLFWLKEFFFVSFRGLGTWVLYSICFYGDSFSTIFCYCSFSAKLLKTLFIFAKVWALDDLLESKACSIDFSSFFVYSATFCYFY